ncbi:MAG: hypothetical protein Q9217_004208 [Psora testacea]
MFEAWSTCTSFSCTSELRRFQWANTTTDLQSAVQLPDLDVWGSNEDEIRFLMTINSEAKVRRPTKSMVLGTVRVISYKDLKEARAKRAEKEAAKETKGKAKRGQKCKKATLEAVEATANKVKHGRKRKSATPEAEARELTAKVARTCEAPKPARAPVAQMSETQVAEDEIAARGMELRAG